MNAFTRADSATRPQRVSISWTRELLPDEHADKPDESDDGFWPSTDPEAAGYIGPDGDFTAAQEKAEERMAAWRRGDWEFIGVVAAAVIHIPIGGISFRVLSLRSAGLWGVESDSGEDYLRETYEEEKAELRRELAALGGALASGDFDEEEEL